MFVISEMGTCTDETGSSLSKRRTLTGSCNPAANSRFVVLVDCKISTLTLILFLTISLSQFYVKRLDEVQSNLTWKFDRTF